MKSKIDKSFIITKDELTELFITNKIQETNRGWVLENKRIDILALHPRDIKYIENLHKVDEYKIVYKD